MGWTEAGRVRMHVREHASLYELGVSITITFYQCRLCQSAASFFFSSLFPSLYQNFHIFIPPGCTRCPLSRSLTISFPSSFFTTARPRGPTSRPTCQSVGQHATGTGLFGSTNRKSRTESRCTTRSSIPQMTGCLWTVTCMAGLYMDGMG
ncbi:hypothetical protein BKA81DRAFT_35966 [Phyllosticta paracitricarpa]